MEDIRKQDPSDQLTGILVHRLFMLNLDGEDYLKEFDIAKIADRLFKETISSDEVERYFEENAVLFASKTQRKKALVIYKLEHAQVLAKLMHQDAKSFKVNSASMDYLDNSLVMNYAITEVNIPLEIRKKKLLSYVK